MMTDNLKKAEEILHSEKCTCVLIKGNDKYISYERGVKPLILWLENKVDLKGFSAADKVVGKATAFLYVLAGIKELYADVISREAIKVMEKAKIPVEYQTLTEYIINRAGNGPCPMESAVKDIDDEKEAYEIIKKR